MQMHEDAKAASAADVEKVRDVIAAPLAATHLASDKVLKAIVALSLCGDD